MRQASGVVLAIAFGVAVAACGGDKRPANGQGGVATSGSGADNGQTMTVTGCVQAGNPAGTYVLANTRSEMTTGASGSGGSSGASGTSGTSGSAGNERAFSGETGRYRLIADANLDFGRHLGKEVRVTGTIATVPDSSAPAGTTGGQQAPPDSTPPPGTTGGSVTGGAGSGQVGAGLESRSNQGSGGGRVMGGAPDRSSAARFLRVTSLTPVADTCGAGR